MASAKGTKQNPGSLGPFPKGMNNIAPEYAVPTGFARDLVNVDVTDTGHLKRRQGFVQALAGTNITSAWSTGKTAYVVDGGVLKKISADANGAVTSQTITNSVGAILSRAAAFVDMAGTTLVSDGGYIYKVGSSALTRFTYDAPSLNSVSSAAGNSAFLVAVTGALPDGETPAQLTYRTVGTYPVTVNVAAYPYPVNVYVSAPDGTELFFVGTSTGAPVIVNSTSTPGRVLTTANMAPIPAGTMLRYAFGRLFSVVGDTVFFSLPYYPSAYAPTEGFIPFTEKITVFEPINTGIVIGTASEIAFLDGTDPGKFGYRVLANYGAVPGTAHVTDQKSVMLMSAQGEVMITPGGSSDQEQFVNLQEDKVAVHTAGYGSAGQVAGDGIDRLVTSLFNANLSRAGASSFMDAEIVRKGVVL